MHIAPKNITITSFYCFTKINEPITIKAQIQLLCRKLYLKGTILLANEGFNGSLAGEATDVETALQKLIQLTDANNVNIKSNECSNQPFDKLKIKIKSEIVTLNVTELDLSQRGDYIKPIDWDNFIAGEDVVVIDTRNNYEVALGKFKNAVDPLTSKFSDLPQWVSQHQALLQNKKIAMYCTGGIRCEKSTAYLKSQGYKAVYHLEGGILQYLADTDNANNIWQGKCFVFDNRIAVNEKLSPTNHEKFTI